MSDDDLRTIRSVNLTGKRVLLRVGWDVPLAKLKTPGSKFKIVVTDDIRIRESLPTLRYLIDHGAQSITIIFHVGRPKGKVMTELSVKPVVERFVKLIGQQKLNFRGAESPKGSRGFRSHLRSNIRISTIHHSGDALFDVYEVTGLPIIIRVFENLRFDPQEENNDDQFAKELAHNHDLYVNDAFSNSHRKHASMVAITRQLPAYAGLLVEDELKHLDLLRHNPPKPFIVIIGGAKIKDKMPIIKEMATMAESVLLGGKTGLEYAKHYLNRRNYGPAKKNQPANFKIQSGVRIIKNGSADIFPPIDDHDGRDIGPKTIELFVNKIKTAQTIFWNGNMGLSEDKRYINGTRKITQAIAESNARLKIAGGGDTTAFIHEHGMAKAFTFLSSGGGATLVYLAGGKMPGLEPLFNQ